MIRIYGKKGSKWGKLTASTVFVLFVILVGIWCRWTFCVLKPTESKEVQLYSKAEVQVHGICSQWLWAGTGIVDRCRRRKSAQAKNPAKVIELENRSVMRGAWLWNDKFRNIEFKLSEEVDVSNRSGRFNCSCPPWCGMHYHSGIGVCQKKKKKNHVPWEISLYARIKQWYCTRVDSGIVGAIMKI